MLNKKVFFSALLKDVPRSPYEMLPFPEKDAARMAMYASLDFKGLYTALVQLLDIAPIIQFGHRGKSIKLLDFLFEEMVCGLNVPTKDLTQ